MMPRSRNNANAGPPILMDGDSQEKELALQVS